MTEPFDLPFEKIASGKVREIYALDADRLLFVATDRISAYDVIMNEPIHDKGKLLTGMSLFWFELLQVCPNHLISLDVPEEVAGRAMVVKRLEMLPVEFVVRGYLVGSGWKDYQATGTVCGVPLPTGLIEADRLEEPIFTPATKATSGHDVNITEDEAAAIIGPVRLKTAKQYALDVYKTAASYAADRGLIVADTKFEFGLDGDEIVLADEVLTPDSSRFWPADQWKPGSSPPSFDKQVLRDWLDQTGWNREPPPPALPLEVIEKTRSLYVEAYERLTGRNFAEVS